MEVWSHSGSCLAGPPLCSDSEPLQWRTLADVVSQRGHRVPGQWLALPVPCQGQGDGGRVSRLRTLQTMNVAGICRSIWADSILQAPEHIMEIKSLQFWGLFHAPTVVVSFVCNPSVSWHLEFWLSPLLPALPGVPVRLPQHLCGPLRESC